MKHKILSIVYLMLCTASSSLNAEASETSEERQRDTFTLYDRNRREVNWQRQQRQARAASEARDRYRRNATDYSQANTRGSNGPVNQDRSYVQQDTRGWNGPVNQNRGYYTQQPSSSYPGNRVDRGYYHTDDYEYGDVRTNPNYSLVPAVPPIE